MRHAGQVLLYAAIAFTVFVAHAAVAEVFKCIDENGHASYQDTTCPATAFEANVDTRYVNSLPLGFARKDADLISRLADEANAREQAREKRQREHIDSIARRIKDKQERCKALKADYRDMKLSRRRYGRGDPQVESDLVAKMRDACSG